MIIDIDRDVASVLIQFPPSERRRIANALLRRRYRLPNPDTALARIAAVEPGMTPLKEIAERVGANYNTLRVYSARGHFRTARSGRLTYAHEAEVRCYLGK